MVMFKASLSFLLTLPYQTPRFNKSLILHWLLLTEFIFDWHIEVLNEDYSVLVFKTLSILNGYRHDALLVYVWVNLELQPPLLALLEQLIFGSVGHNYMIHY
jgi:hypothetical protein